MCVTTQRFWSPQTQSEMSPEKMSDDYQEKTTVLWTYTKNCRLESPKGSAIHQPPPYFIAKPLGTHSEGSAQCDGRMTKNPFAWAHLQSLDPSAASELGKEKG